VEVCSKYVWNRPKKESEIESLGSLKKAIFFRKRVLQLQKMAKNACFACVARVARVACVHCDFQRIKATICCDFCGFCVFSVVFSCLDLRRTFSKAPSQGVGSRAENYVPIKIFSLMCRFWVFLKVCRLIPSRTMRFGAYGCV
jgi:hypothetical protein